MNRFQKNGRIAPEQTFNKMPKVRSSPKASDVACQKLLKSVSVSRSYSKHNTGTVFWDTVHKTHAESRLIRTAALFNADFAVLIGFLVVVIVADTARQDAE